MITTNETILLQCFVKIHQGPPKVFLGCRFGPQSPKIHFWVPILLTGAITGPNERMPDVGIGKSR